MRNCHAELMANVACITWMHSHTKCNREDGCSKFLQNVGIHPPDHILLQSTKTYSDDLCVHSVSLTVALKIIIKPQLVHELDYAPVQLLTRQILFFL
jgi:hypothetical protein